MKFLLLIIALYLTQLNADTNREGPLAGVGIGLSSAKGENETSRTGGSAVSFKFGYGVHQDLLIYITGEGAGRTDDLNNEITEVVAGIGVSYYINDLHYIKATIGDSSIKLKNSRVSLKLTGTGYNFGYGYVLSNKSSVELTYTDLSLNILEFLGTSTKVSGSSSTISVIYQYYWF